MQALAMQDNLYNIHFHGSLSKYAEGEIKLYAKNIKDAFQGLVARFGDTFKDEIINNAWHITSGKRESEELKETDNFIAAELVEFPIVCEELHVFPAINGAGGKGIGQIILGIVLIVVAVVLWWAAPAIGAAYGAAAGAAASSAVTSVALAGVMAIAGGVMAMMTKTPSISDYSQASGTDPKNSFIFNGPVNNTEQGVPVPLVYGIHLTGSTIVSAGLDSERM